MPSETARYAAWVAVLDKMEEDAGLARPADPPVADHRTPETMGPIPAELVGRARSVLAAQREAIGVIEGKRDLAARHLAALRSVPATRDAAQSVYLDVLS